ncbi:hypothetical protein [Clostridium folliculivorans]|uniref:Uncharacterized protein n=1 Tax=Clostridium folliculivorans TaxID=2886038 RepID=A0A9W6DA56_9CLOT|nr:hypothetical protein [Clostridium folliculivorans]GKU24616.1 hypothetical protein CFOLD11_14420 [Clostridium folliculivorans]GKU30714.1 hypothetical protein CFB3_28210 [Clostridium folliculivorans]
MYVIPQVLPTIFVVNKSDQDLEDIFITIEDYRAKDPKIKKIKCGDTKTISIYNRGYAGTKALYLYHYDKNNVKHQYIIYDQMTAGYCNNIRVLITSVDKTGSLHFSVTLDYDNTRTH